jgi:hypothetical protein
MINGFLNVSRLDAAKLVLDKKSFSLSTLIEDVVAEMLMTVSTHEFKLDLDQSIMVNAGQG